MFYEEARYLISRNNEADIEGPWGRRGGKLGFTRPQSSLQGGDAEEHHEPGLP
jgi:hypothetical protein